MPQVFEGLDLADFWEDSDYATKRYVGEDVTDEMIRSVENELRYKLPAAYIALLKTQNGGYPKRTNHRMTERTSWAENHIAITGIYGIDRKMPVSVCGEFSTQFWMDEWGYPPIGIYCCDCPSAGHDMICLDYRECGPKGEPCIVHVDQEADYKITLVAPNFEQFIRGLAPDEEFSEQ